MDGIKWKYLGYHGENIGLGFEEYESEDGKLCKQVWDDGFEEVFKVAKCDVPQ